MAPVEHPTDQSVGTPARWPPCRHLQLGCRPPACHHVPATRRRGRPRRHALRQRTRRRRDRIAPKSGHVDPAAGAPVPVLTVDDLDIDFWVDGNWYPAVDGREFDARPRRGAGDRRRVRLGQVDDRDVDPGPAAEELRTSHGSIKLGDRELVGAPASVLRGICAASEIAVIFQEPMTALNPVYTIGFQIVEMLRSHHAMSPKAARATGHRTADHGRDPGAGAAGRRLPAPTVRWPAAARDDRPVAGAATRSC